MSISYRTYVGPYVRCTVETIEVEKQRRACTNVACAMHKSNIWSIEAKHCHLCGSAIRDVTYLERGDAVNDWDVMEAVEERLSPAFGAAYAKWSVEHRAHIYVANVTTEGRDCHLEERQDFALVEITPLGIIEELTRFKVQFADELLTMRKMYGISAVSLHWGVLQDYN
jgi:hypothetical protein